MYSFCVNLYQFCWVTLQPSRFPKKYSPNMMNMIDWVLLDFKSCRLATRLLSPCACVDCVSERRKTIRNKKQSINICTTQNQRDMNQSIKKLLIFFLYISVFACNSRNTLQFSNVPNQVSNRPDWSILSEFMNQFMIKLNRADRRHWSISIYRPPFQLTYKN